MASIFEKQLVTREQWVNQCYNKSKSDSVTGVCNTALMHWDKFLSSRYPGKPESDIISELKGVQNTPEFATFLNQFVQFLANEQGVSPRSVTGYFNSLKSWLRANAIRINSDDIKQFVHFPKRVRESRFALEHHHIVKLCNHAGTTMKTLIVTLMSSGMRMGECLQLRVRDVDFENCIVTLRAETTKTKEERKAFISAEARDMLLHLIRTKGREDPDSLIFCKQFTYTTKIYFMNRFANLREKAGLDDRYQTTGRHKISLHVLRSFFDTMGTQTVGRDITHALMGHHEYLDQYLRLSDREQKERYKKIEPYVSLSSEHTLKEELEETKKEVRSQDSIMQELKMMRDESRQIKDVNDAQQKELEELRKQIQKKD